MTARVEKVYKALQAFATALDPDKSRNVFFPPEWEALYGEATQAAGAADRFEGILAELVRSYDALEASKLIDDQPDERSKLAKRFAKARAEALLAILPSTE